MSRSKKFEIEACICVRSVAVMVYWRAAVLGAVVLMLARVIPGADVKEKFVM